MDRNDFTADLYEKMTKELTSISRSEPDIIQLAKESFNTVKSYTINLREYILDIGFDNDQEEVLFFKETKPMFYKFLIYFSKLLHLELAKPTGGLKPEKKYFQLHLSRIVYFFQKYQEFYKYLRGGGSDLDQHYFLRTYQTSNPHPELEGIDKDKDFSTSHDYLVAKVSANEMMEEYLNDQINRVIREYSAPVVNPLKVLSWTASKAALTELLYALSSSGVFNQGQSSLQQIAAFFEHAFNIKLGNYYRAFQELRIRKKNRTQFLDELKSQLLDKMEYDDEHPR